MIFEHFAAMDRRLVAAGFPSTSPWWLDTLGRFYASSCRQLVLRVGRRGGKSSTLSKIGVVEALAGEHHVPPGDLGLVSFISISRDEALKRLRGVEAILRALGVGFRPLREGQGIELVDRPIGFQVLTASIGGVSGFTSIACICDEAAKWRDADSGANPAAEVLASLRPTMATMPRARMFLSSSPFGPADAHARAFDLGDTDGQMVAHAPTWVANPTVTEEQTHALEPDPRIWSREYAALPQTSALAAFDVDAIDRAFAPRVATKRGRRSLVLDPSSGRNDAWTWCLAGWDEAPTGERFLTIESIGAVQGRFWDQVSGDRIVADLVTLCRERGILHVHADQREALMLRAAFMRAGLRYQVHDWTAGNKVSAVERLRRWLKEGALAIEPHEQMRRELLAFEEKVTPSGSLTFGGRGAHDDFVALLVTASLADLRGSLHPEGSPSPQVRVRSIGSNVVPISHHRRRHRP